MSDPRPLARDRAAIIEETAAELATQVFDLADALDVAEARIEELVGETEGEGTGGGGEHEEPTHQGGVLDLQNGVVGQITLNTAEELTVRNGTIRNVVGNRGGTIVLEGVTIDPPYRAQLSNRLDAIKGQDLHIVARDCTIHQGGGYGIWGQGCELDIDASNELLDPTWHVDMDVDPFSPFRADETWARLYHCIGRIFPRRWRQRNRKALLVRLCACGFDGLMQIGGIIECGGGIGIATHQCATARPEGRNCGHIQIGPLSQTLSHRYAPAFSSRIVEDLDIIQYVGHYEPFPSGPGAPIGSGPVVPRIHVPNGNLDITENSIWVTTGGREIQLVDLFGGAP